MDSILVNKWNVNIKEYNGKRVATFKDIDQCHERPSGTARKRFNDNKKHFIEGVDYFKISPSEFRTAIGDMDKRQQNDITLLTESGYLMVVKSFKDDLSWIVQRMLVNNYFRVNNYSEPTAEMLAHPKTMIKVLTALKEEQERANKLEEKVKEDEPKIDFVDTVLRGKGLVSITTIAKDYGLSAIKLNKILKDEGIQFKSKNGNWYLYQKYAKRGYIKSKTTLIITDDGKESTRTNTYWTQKGRMFIHELLKEKNINPINTIPSSSLELGVVEH